MRPITESQADVLRAITILSERKGYITRTPRRARTIRVLRTAEGGTGNGSG